MREVREGHADRLPPGRWSTRPKSKQGRSMDNEQALDTVALGVSSPVFVVGQKHGRNAHARRYLAGSYGQKPTS